MSDDTAPLSDDVRADSGDEYACGTPFGRYVILSTVGRGGAGSVYAAFDSHLDRKVALKLLHSKWEDGDKTFEALLAEARVLARLTHPNVVTVHDVGNHEGKVFVAMELVDGEDLGSWLERQRSGKSEPPDAARILDIFVRAGRGLVAAHRQDIVHRDFKPRNVLVASSDDDDGHLDVVKVGDFGLAHSSGGRAATRDDAGRLDAPGSVTGDTDPPPGLLGTPAYMAPEQHEGEEVDARADQYAFCVSLWEALTGRRPFEAGTVFALAESKRAGPPPWPKDDATPRWIVPLLHRGLSPRPVDRWPSMEPLLARLEAGDPRARLRRRLGVGAGAVALVAVGAALGPWRSADSGRCSGASQELEGVWNAARRTETASAMGSVPSSFAADTSTRVVAKLDDYANRWVDAHRGSCEATARGEQSTEGLDASMACLRRQLGAFDGLVEVLHGADADVLARAFRAVGELDDPQWCRDVSPDAGLDPADPSQRETAERIRSELARIEAVASAGRYAEAMRQFQGLRPEIDAIDHAPLQAEALVTRGRLELDNGELEPGVETLQEAYGVGLRSSHFDAATEAAVLLTSTFVAEFEDYQATLRWAEHARPLAERDGLDNRRTARIGFAIAAAHRIAGDYEQAERQLAATEQLLARLQLPEDDPLRESILVGRGHLYMAMGRYADALEQYTAARELVARVLGEDHPGVAKRINDMGSALSQLERFDEAIELLKDSVHRIEAALGPDHPEVASTKINLAAGLGAVDRFDEAIDLMEDVLEVKTRVYGENSLELYRPLVNLGVLYKQKRQPEKALELAEKALALQETALGPDHPSLCPTLLNLASIHVWLGNHEQTEAYYQRMLALAHENFESPHPYIADALLGLANLRIGEKRWQEALAAYERATIEYEGLGKDAQAKIPMILVGRAIALQELGRNDAAGRLYYEATQRGFVGSHMASWERAMAQLEAGKWLWSVRDEHEGGEAEAIALVRAAIVDAEAAGEWGLEFKQEAEAFLKLHG